MSDLNDTTENTEFTSIWQRLLYMLLFIVLYSVGEFVIYAVAAVQLLWVIFTGDKNPNLLSLGNGLSLWACEVFKFLTFNNERLPYPFNSWPSE
ncbi:MAG: DUF4389 domain-containing protein [Pseudomonadales bacterium]|nr:DUF4389 domain-containing protein [Pseudomonadales bacterium]